jgi:hypothetical protein
MSRVCKSSLLPRFAYLIISYRSLIAKSTGKMSWHERPSAHGTLSNVRADRRARGGSTNNLVSFCWSMRVEKLSTKNGVEAIVQRRDSWLTKQISYIHYRAPFFPNCSRVSITVTVATTRGRVHTRANATIHVRKGRLVDTPTSRENRTVATGFIGQSPLGGKRES